MVRKSLVVIDVKKLPTSLIQPHCFKLQSYPRSTKILQFTSFATSFVFGKKLAALTTKDCATKVSIKQVLMYYTDLYRYIYTYISMYMCLHIRIYCDVIKLIWIIFRIFVDTHEFLLISIFHILHVFVSN